MKPVQTCIVPMALPDPEFPEFDETCSLQTKSGKNFVALELA